MSICSRHFDDHESMEKGPCPFCKMEVELSLWKELALAQDEKLCFMVYDCGLNWTQEQECDRALARVKAARTALSLALTPKEG